MPMPFDKIIHRSGSSQRQVWFWRFIEQLKPISRAGLGVLWILFKVHFLKIHMRIDNVIQTELGSGFPRHSTHPYRKGMFISLSNSRMYANQLLGTFKRQYQSVLRSVGIKIGRGCIKQTNRMPSKDKINSLIRQGYPIATAAIHDNPVADRDGKHFQHYHVWVYNIANYLPSDAINLRDSISKVSRANSRYVGNKHIVNGVDIRPVGTFKHYQEHDLLDADYHDYLLTSLNSPRRDCLINYMAHNRHNPDISYDLTYLYPDLDYLPINLSNRTITTA